jgi:hypothetical protein
MRRFKNIKSNIIPRIKYDRNVLKAILSLHLWKYFGKALSCNMVGLDLSEQEDQVMLVLRITVWVSWRSRIIL